LEKTKGAVFSTLRMSAKKLSKEIFVYPLATDWRRILTEGHPLEHF